MGIILNAMLIVLSAVGPVLSLLESRYVQAADAQTVLMNPQDKFWAGKAARIFQVRFKTTKGDFLVEVRRDLAPHGADRFYNLVRAGFFTLRSLSRRHRLVALPVGLLFGRSHFVERRL